MEMRGFAAMATQLSKELERIATEIIDDVLKDHNCTNRMHLGGDTWYFAFDDTFSWGS